MLIIESRPKPAVVHDTDSMQPATDRTVWWLALCASAMSVGAFVYFLVQDVTLSYADAISHLEIARRVVDSPTADLTQLGGVWLPLPHVLSLPFIWLDGLYFSGLAGSIISMAAYVVTTVFLYRIAFHLTGQKLAGIVAAAFFAFNPNVLYLQSTPMTEVLLFACMAAMVFYVQRWIQTGQDTHLIGAGVSSMLATLTRYEAWILLAALLIVMVVVAKQKGYSYARGEGSTLAFIAIGGVGIVAWVVWNQLILGNGLGFLNGEYAKPSLWVGAAEATVGNWWVSLQTYSLAVVHNLGLFTIIIAVIGLVGVFVRKMFSLSYLPALALLVLFPFFVFALESGQRPLHVEEVSNDLYNVRFGLLMILPAAILVGCAVTLLIGYDVWTKVVAGVAVAGAVVFALASFMQTDGIVTLKEPLAFAEQTHTTLSAEAGAFLRQQYQGGDILMESFGNELVLFDAGITPSDNIYEGSYRLWEPALENPSAQHIEWVVMRAGDQPDKVYDALNESSAMDQYELVYQNSDYYVFKERS